MKTSKVRFYSPSERNSSLCHTRLLGRLATDRCLIGGNQGPEGFSGLVDSGTPTTGSCQPRHADTGSILDGIGNVDLVSDDVNAVGRKTRRKLWIRERTAQ